MFVTFNETRFNALTANGVTSKGAEKNTEGRSCRILTNLLVRGEHSERGRFIKSTSSLTQSKTWRNLASLLAQRPISMWQLSPATIASFDIFHLVEYRHKIINRLHAFARANPNEARMLRDRLYIHSGQSTLIGKQKKKLDKMTDTYGRILLDGVNTQPGVDIDLLADELQAIIEPDEDDVTYMKHNIMQNLNHTDDTEFMWQFRLSAAAFTRGKPEDAESLIALLDEEKQKLQDKKLQTAIAKFQKALNSELAKLNEKVAKLQKEEEILINELSGATKGGSRKDYAMRRKQKEVSEELERLKPGSSVKNATIESKPPTATEDDIVRCHECKFRHRFPSILLSVQSKPRFAPGCTCKSTCVGFIFMADIMQLYAYSDHTVKKQLTPTLMTVIPETVWTTGNIKTITLQFMHVKFDDLRGAAKVHSLEQLATLASTIPVLSADDVDDVVPSPDSITIPSLSMALSSFDPIAALSGLAAGNIIDDVEEHELDDIDITVFDPAIEDAPVAPHLPDESADTTVENTTVTRVRRDNLIYDQLYIDISAFIRNRNPVFTFVVEQTDARPRGSERYRDSIDRTWFVRRKTLPGTFMVIGTHANRNEMITLMEYEAAFQNRSAEGVVVVDSIDEIAFNSKDRTLFRVLLISSITTTPLSELTKNDSQTTYTYGPLFSHLLIDGIITRIEDTISPDGLRCFEWPSTYPYLHHKIGVIGTSNGTFFFYRENTTSKNLLDIATSIPIGDIVVKDETKHRLPVNPQLFTALSLPMAPEVPAAPPPAVPALPAAPPPPALPALPAAASPLTPAVFGISRLFRSGSALSLVLAR
jgi:hypothetical protein